ncbi:MAG TPA: MarR family transcriptional regulator [Chitinophagales bacterium]|nr:MarR family transcriptional regulator [Chitinophagales bacterium]
MQNDILKLENQVCFPIYAASRLVTRLYQPYFDKLDITYPQYLVFLLLWEKDNRNVSDISHCLYLESSTLTPLLKRMEAKGYIKRSRSAQDERSVLIQLTAKGKKLEEKASAIPTQIVGKMQTEEIGVEEILKMKDTLQKITRLISAQ